MLWPNEAKTAIADAFYDKTIEILSSEPQLDAEGGVIRGTQSVRTSFTGNVRFNNLGELQSELGLSESIDISVTCDTSVDINLNDLFRYNGETYAATSVIPSDSHLTIVGRKYVAARSN